MAFNLKGRNFLSLLDFTTYEIDYLLKLSLKLKQDKYSGTKHKLLEGKNVALLFEKPSTRTRCAFVTACNDEGAFPEYLGKGDIQFGKKESVKDTARVLGRYFDAIEFRGFKHTTVVGLGQWAGVPVWNGLTDLYHPTQILADLLTIIENFGKLKGLTLSYVGDGRNNMARSLLIGGVKMGMEVRIVSPSDLQPDDEFMDVIEGISKETGGSFLLTDNIENGVSGAHVIYTDVWVSMGEEDQWDARVKKLMPYQVNSSMINKTNNPETIFLHCLPAFHNHETDLSKESGALEVSEEVFESSISKVFDQAENRMHTIKAVMVATIGNQ